MSYQSVIIKSTIRCSQCGAKKGGVVCVPKTKKHRHLRFCSREHYGEYRKTAMRLRYSVKGGKYETDESEV